MTLFIQKFSTQLQTTKSEDFVHNIGATGMEQRIELRNLEARLRQRDSNALAEEQKNKVTSELKKTEEKTDEQRTGLGVTGNVIAEMERTINLAVDTAKRQSEKENKGRLLKIILYFELSKHKNISKVTWKLLQNAKLLVSELWVRFTDKVAFSVSAVFTKIGTSFQYNPTLGKFITAIRGLYYFRFTVFESCKWKVFVVHLCGNKQKIMSNWEQNNKEDMVFMHPPSGYLLYDDANNHNTFRGFPLLCM
uniref:C1q domain-containing protein n=1 Tax=Myripristis murdjan TaxID=586833 RepID=A0A667WSJ6_9TELE